jgi:hypothetical protein
MFLNNMHSSMSEPEMTVPHFGREQRRLPVFQHVVFSMPLMKENPGIGMGPTTPVSIPGKNR